MVHERVYIGTEGGERHRERMKNSDKTFTIEETE